MGEIRYSEDPTADIWKKLQKYSFGSNIKKLTGIHDEGLLNSISGSIVQANEYFSMAGKASLNTSPLLMYYGCVNLLYGVGLMKSKNRIEIKSHGATLSNAETVSAIGDTEILLSGAKDGAFFCFNKIFAAENAFPRCWSVRDLLSYIPDIKSDFEDCYAGVSSNCIPLETVKRKNDKIDRIKLSDLKTPFNSMEIVNFEKVYLKAQTTNEYVVLHNRLKSMEIGVYSISGQNNLVRYKVVEGSNFYVDQIVAIFLCLYALSVLSRYHPGKWFPFVQRDDSGEKGLIEDFLSVASRKLPNLVLNVILEKDIQFLHTAVGNVDLSKDYDPDEVKRIVNEELRISKLRY